eukprot:m.125 g.125  ORF g.125 m.125 type:complete len:93 (+) comp680_c0_seq1:296-574(+)
MQAVASGESRPHQETATFTLAATRKMRDPLVSGLALCSRTARPLPVTFHPNMDCERQEALPDNVCKLYHVSQHFAGCRCTRGATFVLSKDDR